MTIGQDRETDEREQPDGEPEDELAAHPLPEHALDQPDDGPGVEPPGRRERRVELVREGHPVLEQVEDPDRQDDVAEDRPDEAARAGDERHQEREVEGRRLRAALSDARDERIDPFADRLGDLEALVELAETLQLALELLGERGEVLDEQHELVDERREGQVQELDEREERDDVDAGDGDRPADAAADEPADRRIQQPDDEQADDERPEAVARHPQQQADDDGRRDQHARRAVRAPRTGERPAGDAGSTNGGGGSVATHADVVDVPAPGAGGRSAIDRSGSSIVRQTTRRAGRPRDPRASLASAGASSWRAPPRPRVRRSAN